MPKVKIYSASVCPFAQRSRLVLLEKGIDFDLIEIDLQNKPEEFTTISPYSKVPVILHGDDRVWESTIINEYLEDVFPEPPLLPQPPGQKAIARIWIDFANTKFIPAFYKLLINQDQHEQTIWAEELQKHLLFIEHEGLRKLSASGPFWLGESLSLVDLSYYPWFERWAAVEHYRGLSLPAECDRLKQWWAAMNQRESVQATLHPADFHVQQYAKYASDSAMGVTIQELRRY